jgi:hypothetical protein
VSEFRGGTSGDALAVRASPRAFGGHSPNLVHLDSESVEAVARRVVELLTGDTASGLIDAAELARRMGVSRDWIYRNRERLGAVRVGDGKRARLRFNPAIACSQGKRSPVEEAPAQREKPRGRPRARTGTNVDLLPIRGSKEGA